ncbi:MAG: hypothetical protein JWQ68_46, partial [Cryobacterium sp.]|nr:hypothetical protein [Cryobacterium sp.]
MNWLLLLVPTGVILLGYLAARLGWIDLSNKTNRRGSGTSVMVIGDEIFA